MLKYVARLLLVLLFSAAAFFLLSLLYFSYGEAYFEAADAAPLLVLALLIVLAIFVGSILSRFVRYYVWPGNKVIAVLLVLLAGSFLTFEILVYGLTGRSPFFAPVTLGVEQQAEMAAEAPSKPEVQKEALDAQEKQRQAELIRKRLEEERKRAAVATQVQSAEAQKSSEETSEVNRRVNIQSNTAAMEKSESTKIETPSPVKKDLNAGIRSKTFWSSSSAKSAEPEYGQQTSNGSKFPVFPNNPPKASAREVIPNVFFLKEGEPNPTLLDIARKLLGALNSAGYFETSFYQFRGNGFALATKLEKINEDGTPVSGEERWSADVKPNLGISFTDYIKNLFLSETGYYRIIVFIVSAEAFTQSGEADRETAEDWVSSGANVLQQEIATEEFTENHHCTALIYVFEKPETEPSKFAGNWLQGRTHLEKAKIWSALNQ